MYTYDQLKKGDKKLQQVEEEQKRFKSELGQIKLGDPEKKLLTKLDTKNVENLYDSRQKIIDLLNDNSRVKSEAIYKANEKTTGTGLKILTIKQMLQRLLIALAQVKAGNNSESLSNKLFILCISQNKSLKNYTIT